jgi:hypothetical protein
MKPEYRQRWERERAHLHAPPKKPADLFRRAVSNEDCVDSALIGGVMLMDVIAGKVAEHQIPNDVVEAFHLQYPNQGDFVNTVREHAHDPYALAGLINGIKGKLFEDRYVGWLNEGHLPDGFHAELAQAANNPGWDIAIKDSHGHISDVLQAKATTSMDYVHEALKAHPDIDVVTTSEVFDSLSQKGTDLSDLVDSHQDLAGLTDHVDDGVSYAEAASDVSFHIPAIAIGWAILQNVSRYRKGTIAFDEAWRNVRRRIGLAFGAAGAGFLVADAFAPGVGIGTAVLVRLYGNRVFGNLDLRDIASRSVDRCKESARYLKRQLPRRIELLLAEASTATGTS